MVVKEKRGRRRYIAFTSDEKVSNEDLVSALNSAFGERGMKTPKIIQFDGRKGIVRTSDVDKAKSIEILNSISGRPFSLSTLRTSGTLRTLRERYFTETSTSEAKGKRKA